MYEFLDHPSEALVRVTGKTTEEIFVDSAKALFELMTDTKQIHPDLYFDIELGSPDKLLLLIDWLNRLIFLHEVENVFLSEFQVQIQSGRNLKAKTGGEKITPDQERRLHAKSATYGQLQWNETPEGHQVQFVIDV
jgi:SHS2 domain-containing protein